MSVIDSVGVGRIFHELSDQYRRIDRSKQTESIASKHSAFISMTELAVAS